MAMRTGETLEGRREQKPILKALYPDYDPKHHEVFVIRYNQDQEKTALDQYMKNRGLSLT
jgi:hypothetical protein